MKIIDSHVHFPPCMHRQANSGASTASSVIRTDIDIWRSMSAAARRSGIGQLVVSNLLGGGGYPTQEELHECNRFCIEEAQRSNGLLAPLVYLNPQLPDWEKELDGVRAEGAVGAKLWISLKDVNGSLENSLKVLQGCAKRRFPVLIHVFERTGGNLPGEINMSELLCLAEQVPDCTIIAAHSGGNLTAAMPAIRKCPSNVFFDICGSAPNNGMLAQLLTAVSPKRVLYGSDAMGRSFDSQLLKIFDCKLTEEERELILWRNAASIYGLPEPPDLDCPASECHAPERDFCIFSGSWPYGGFTSHSPTELNALLATEGVLEAWAPSLEAVLTKDTLDANLAYLKACQGKDHIKPLAVLNPASGNWKRDIARIDATGGFAGIWFSPCLHSYATEDSSFQGALKECAVQHITVFLNFGVTEYRFHPPEVNWRDTSTAEISSLLSSLPSNTYFIQGMPYVDCTPPAGVHLCWVNSRTADRYNSKDEYPSLPLGISWVDGSEYPFRPLKCYNGKRVK